MALDWVYGEMTGNSFTRVHHLKTFNPRGRNKVFFEISRFVNKTVIILAINQSLLAFNSLPHNTTNTPSNKHS